MPTITVTDSRGDQLLAFGALLARSGKVIESEISGTSMGSTLPSGCRIRIRPSSVEEYRVGQVVAFVAGNRLFAHRIVYRTCQGVLTRGDTHPWCDLPAPVGTVLGVVSECQVAGEWRPFDDSVRFACEKRKRSRMFETLLGMCMRVDIRLAQCASRILMRLSHWCRLVAKAVWVS